MSARHPPEAAPGGPRVGPDAVTFTLPDPERRLTGVTLRHGLRGRPGPSEFARDDGYWTLRWRLPDLTRMEYQLALRRDEREEVVCDPGNPLRAPGPFGEKSVLELPGYRPPRWLPGEPVEVGSLRAELIDTGRRGGAQPVQIWSPAGSRPERPLPLLVALDGPEYAAYSGLLVMLSRLVAAGELPPLRAALLPPLRRDEDYSASAAASRRLAGRVLPALEALAPAPTAPRCRIGMGASLGALAMLHVQRAHAGAFGALFLQSGSFFRPRTDAQMSGMRRFRRICRFTGATLRSGPAAEPVPVVMTCGRGEENVDCNRLMAAALARQGYDLRYHESGDAHNWISWRDCFDPFLSDLLRRMWA